MQIGRHAIAIGGVLCEAPLDDPPHENGAAGNAWQRRPVLRSRWRPAFRRGRASERRLAGRHLVEDQAQRELIRRKSSGATRLLGAHVRHGADQPARFCLRRYRTRAVTVLRPLKPRWPREAEIEDLGAPGAGHHDVFRLQIAMHDARGVGLGQAVGNLRAEIEKRFRGTGPRRTPRSRVPSISSDTM